MTMEFGVLRRGWKPCPFSQGAHERGRSRLHWFEVEMPGNCVVMGKECMQGCCLICRSPRARRPRHTVPYREFPDRLVEGQIGAGSFDSAARIALLRSG